MSVKIKYLSIDGQGVGYNEDGRKIFVPFTAIDDEVEISVVKENKKIINAEVVKFLSNSKNRIEPKCKYFGICGGCLLQHLNPESYYSFKEHIIQQSVSYAGYSDFKKEIDIKKTDYFQRRRCTFKIKNKKIGFLKRKSDEHVEIDFCPIVMQELNALIKQLNALLSNLKTNIIEISLTKVLNGIECIFIIEDKLDENDVILLNHFQKENELVNICYRSSKDTKIKYIKNYNDEFVKVGEDEIAIPVNSFLQASEMGQSHITNFVLQFIEKNDKVVDLYSGIGTYTFPIARKCDNILAIEGNFNMTNSIKKNSKKLGLKDKIKSENRDLFKKPLVAQELNQFNCAIINPPRTGAKNQIQEITKSNIKKVILVSCNPVTFSNDAKILYEKGFKLQDIIGVDQFYMSNYIEIVAIFRL